MSKGIEAQNSMEYVCMCPLHKVGKEGKGDKSQL
jgi:hypothetical protein